MPKKPKKAGGAKKKAAVSKAAVKKHKDKIISDKTFGLKNKGKSKKVQQYVQRTVNQVHTKYNNRYGTDGMGGGTRRKTYEERKKERELEKEKLLMSQTFAVVKKPKPKPKPVLADVPKEFIEALLTKFYQKYAKDKVQNVPAIVQKFEGKYEKLEAGLRKNYGDKAPKIAKIYEDWRAAHQAELDLFKDASKWEGLGAAAIVIEIEQQRRKLDTSKGTPVTLESFTAWKKKKKAEEEKLGLMRAKEKEQNMKKGRNKKSSGSGGKAKLSGRDLYRLDASIFVDDEDAGGEKDYEIDDSVALEDALKAEPKKDGTKETKEVAGDIDESLFMDDDDIPDSDDD